MHDEYPESRALFTLLERYLSAARIAHCANTAALSYGLCVRFGCDVLAGFTAGLLHDVARELPLDTMKSFAAADGCPFRPWEIEYPVLLHGRAGAVIARNEAGIENEAILDAVRDHTTGKPGMGVIARIVYVSDYLEPGRQFHAGNERESVLARNLHEIMLHVTEQKLRMQARKGRTVIEPVAALYNEIRETLQKT